MARPKKTPSPAEPEAQSTAQTDATPPPPTLDTLDHNSEFAPFDTTVRLSALRLSSLNVRHTDRAADVASLAEDIAARGLKTNLNVIPAHFATAVQIGDESDFTELFEVAGGGRRTQALWLLAEQGRIPPDHPVSVKIEPRADARETSLSENLHRVAINPADEFDAFSQIATQIAHTGEPDPAAYVAKRFGVTRRHVEGRLRLASLAADILEALRTGTLTLDSAKAYAGTTDHALQLKVFKAQLKYGAAGHCPRTVRDALRGASLPLGDGRVKFVGIEAYRAAGGNTETEMFMGTDGEERITDLALLDRLCAENAAPMVAALAKADGFKSGLFAPAPGHTCKTPKPPEGFELKRYDYQTPTAKVKKQRIAIYTVAYDGDGLHLADSFKPVETDQPAASSGYTPMTDEETAQKLHDAWVDVWAARLAIGPFTGTPLEGKVFWPSGSWPAHQIDTEYGEGSDFYDEEAVPVAALVSIKVRVTTAEIEAHRADAEAKVCRIEAEQAARKAAADAKLDDADDDADDEAGEFDQDDLEDADA